MARIKTLTAAIIFSVLPSGIAVGENEQAIDMAISVQEPGQLEMVDWALSRFDAAGLELPPLLIRFPDRDSPLCDGIQGRTFLSTDPIEVRMCWNSEFILLHELAHVWESANFPTDNHGRFNEMRHDVESWASPDDPWKTQGREHAANVIAWGLLEDPYPISETYPNDIASMVEAFHFLTGVSPLHDGGDGIQHPDRSRLGSDSAPPLERGR